MSQESDITLKMIYASLSSNGFYILHVSVVSAKQGEKEKASIMTAAPRPDPQVKFAGQEGRRPKPAVHRRVQSELVDKQNNRSHTYGQY
jgi:hypothetical protein